MPFRSFFQRSQPHRKERRANRGRAGRRPRFEAFEDRRMLSFTPAGDYDVGTDPKSILAADFNHDGQLDLATANSDGNTVSVLLGNVGGTFQPARTSAAGINPFSLAVGDFNADGTLDLAAINYGASGLNVMFGNRDGTFQPPTHIDAGYPIAESLAVGDFNRDGKMDLVVTSNWRPPNYETYPQGQADVLLSLGGGSFAAPRSFGFFDRAIGSAVVTDMNGDLNPDLVTEMPDYSSVLVLLGDGHGNLGGGSVGALSSNPSAAGDVNGDGKTDIVSAPRWYDAPGTVGVMPGDGEGGISYSPDYNSIGGTTDSAILGDFDRDGTLDIAAAITNGNRVSILRNEGTGTFGAAELFAVGQSGSPTTSGDFNLDGFINAADYVVWRKKDGTPEGYAAWRANFGKSVVPIATPNAVATGDFNGDGWLDLATANAQGSVSVLFNDQTWSQVLPTLSVNDAYDITEGNTGTTNVTITVTLSRASNVDVTVHYDTADFGSQINHAVAGIDYTAKSGIVTIPAGQTTSTFTVAVLGDRLVEQTEYFSVELSAPTNATIKDGSGYGQILDDEPRISITDVTKAEGRNNRTTLFTFTVTLSAAYDEAVTMSYRTVDGTATTSDNDFVAKTGTLTFAPGETTKTITIDVKGDNKNETNETFYLDLFDSSSNSLFTKFRGIGTIWNDD